MDYRKFLAKTEEVVLPYMGGAFVTTESRRLRVPDGVAPGWTRFRIEGRKMTALGPADPIDLADRPPRVGHFIAGYLATPDGAFTRLALLPEDEPLVLSPLRGRVWHDGALLFGELLFEAEAEEAARRCLEEGRSLAGGKGIAASLRNAFALGLAQVRARRMGVEVSPIEIRAALGRIAENGVEAAEAELGRIRDRREEELRLAAERTHAREMASLVGRVAREAARTAQRPGQDDPEERIARAIGAADGRLMSSRRLSHGSIEVRYELFGERFITIVDGTTLNVLDAGVCLDGSDREVTLESLPSVIREAIDDGVLVITRR